MSFQSPNYTQTPNDFFAMLPDMTEAELRVTLVMIRQTFGFHRDGFKMGVTKLADAAGLSRQGALDGAKAAEERGTFRRTNPDAITEAEWELVVDDPSSQLIPPLNPVEGSPQPSRGQVGVKERIKKDSKSLLSSMPLGWQVAHGATVTQEQVTAAQLPHSATIEFERAFGFGTLPWSSNTTWAKFQKFVTKVYASDPNVFKDYVEWRKDGGKYKAFSNRKIRENPAAFMDTGYPEFEASKMYRKNDSPTRLL